ncbi:MAG: hypothetical protein GKS06_14915 [Acidobacteria bacterium]|nr:hypothetical protein [Acidobacteriota bacterium]
MPDQLGFSRAVALTILLSLAATLLLAGTAAFPLLDRDEARFARGTIEMLDRGDWIGPHFNDESFVGEPPLTYWLMSAGYGALGYNELGARLYSVIAAIGMTALIFLFGHRVAGKSAAFAAAFAWLTCSQVFLLGRLAIADMSMILAITVIHWALWELLFEDGGRAFEIALWLAAAGGFLAAGPAALITPVITLAVLRAATGPDQLNWRRTAASWGLPLALTLVGIWAVPMLRTGDATWSIDPGVGSPAPTYYLAAIFVSLFPWSPNFGQFAKALRGRWRDRRTAFLLSWIIGPLVILGFSAGQFSEYLPAMLPALLLLLFRHGYDPTTFGLPSRWFYWGLHATAAIALLGVAVYGKWIDVPAQLRDLKIAAAALAGALLALQAAAVLFARAPLRRLNQLAAPTLLVVVAASATHVFAFTIRPITAPLRLLPYYDHVEPSALHTATGYAEPSLVFYADRNWRLNSQPTRSEIAVGGLFVYGGAEWGMRQLFSPGAEETRRQAVASCGTVAAAATSTASSARAVVDERAQAAGAPAFLIESDLSRAVVCGFNFGRLTWTEVVVFYRESTSRSPARP